MPTPNIPPPKRNIHQPKVPFPPGACDCHAHIFGPQTKYPLLPKTHFVPHECPLDAYIAMLRTLGCDRGVLVQPSVYGTDNSAIIDALNSHAFNLRAVAVVAPDITDRVIEDLHAAGFRGIRINTASGTPGLKIEHARALAPRIKPLGWHLQFYSNFRDTPELADELAKLPVDVVIDHFGRIQCSDGLDAPAFQALMGLLQHEHCWAKLMGPYFVSDAAPYYPDVVPFAQAMVNAAPDRIVWGSDWPHPSAKEKMPDDGDLGDMLAAWVPEDTQRKKVLVDNPQRLYGFA